MEPLIKLSIAEINVKSLKEEKDSALLNLHRHLHSLWTLKRKSPKDLVYSLEDIWNAHELVVAEMKARGFKHASSLPGKLPQKKAEEEEIKKEVIELAPISSSGNKIGAKIQLSEVLPLLKSFKIRQPFVYLTGGLVNNGETEGDIDFLVKGDIPAGMLKVVEFRLGRMLPKELSKRISVMSDDFDGPFTNNIPLGDLLFQVNNDLSVVKMGESFNDNDYIETEEGLQEDPLYIEIYDRIIKQSELMFYPKETGKRRAVVQLHFRGDTVHADLRMDIGTKELIGWTLFFQYPGKIKDINTVADGRKIIANYDMGNGNEFLKPILAPKGLQCTPKKPEPIDWIAVEGVVKPGEVGATANEPGIFVIIEDPKKYCVEWGIQKPYYHEYFLTNGKYFNGSLHLRLLSTEGYERAGKNPTFWRGFISKTFLPSVINKRSVKTKSMPPNGVSAMPLSLMQQTPKEFRFWESKGAKAMEIRDALVSEKYFTEENIEIINNEYKRVEKKKIMLSVRDIRKKEVDFSFQYQMWKGQTTVRVGPSREEWTFYFKLKDKGGLDSFVMEEDPTKNIESIAVREIRDKKYLGLDGEVKPGTLGNSTKNTYSWIKTIDEGKATIFEDSEGFIKFQVDLKHIKGLWTMEQEETGSKFWKLKYQKEKSPQAKAVSEEEIFPSMKAKFAPFVKFIPLKPKGGFNIGEFFDVDVLVEKWAKTIFNGKGKVIVNPKWNGYRTIIEKKGDGKDAKLIIFFEDKQEDRAFAMPAISEEVKGIKGDFILDSELIEYTNDKRNDIVNRKMLVRWAATDKPLDDSNLVCRVFGILYWDNEDWLRKPYYEVAQEVEKEIKGFKHLEPTQYWTTNNEKELRDAIEKAKLLPGSEGAVLKLWNSTYTLGGRTSSWAKYKIPRIINAIILDKHKVAGSDKTWNFTGGIGPIPMADKDKYTEVKEFGGKLYVVIGQTFNTNFQGKLGDIVTITASEIFVDDKDGKTHVAWFIPIITALNKVNKPDTVDHVERTSYGEPVVTKELEKFEIFSPIFKVNKDQKTVYGVVLEPNTVDAQGDVCSEEEIAKACHRFMEFHQKIGYQHEDFKKKFRIMECYIAPTEFLLGTQTVKKGSWILGTRVISDDVWKEIKDGKVTGYSIGGFGTRVRRKT